MGSWLDELSEKYMELAIKLTSDMVKFDTTNPPGKECELALYISKVLKDAGFDVRIQEFESNRCNIIASVGNRDKIGLIFNGHLDVVPATGNWKYNKFGGEIQDGLLYGRGSTDMKGGLGAMMATGICIAENDLYLDKGLMMIFVGDEESLNKGIKHVLANNKVVGSTAIIGEPTNLNVCIGNKGYSSVYIQTKGLSCHASNPKEGVNAIYKMARIINKLEDYSMTTMPTIKNEYLGEASLSVGLISGGTKLNIVPDQCICEVERRTLPGESYEDIIGQLQEVVGDLGEVIPRSFMGASLLDPNSDLVNTALESVNKVLVKKSEIDVFGAGTEAYFFDSLNIPTIILGPGSLEQAHIVDEFVEVDQLKKASKIYYEIAKKYLIKDMG